MKVLDYVLSIKNEYQTKFNDYNCLDLKLMIEKLNFPEYNNFAKCVDIIQYNEFCLLSYSLIKGGNIDIFDNPDSIYRDCRGTVINLKTDELVLLPFHKFFNIDEISETSLFSVLEKLKTAKTIEITDKMDGSMISARFYDNDFFIAGTGSLTEDKNSRLTEAKSYLSENYKSLLKDNPFYTFMFELICSQQQIVKYKEKDYGLYLVGARHIKTGKLLDYSTLFSLSKFYDVKITNIEKHSLEEILNMRDKFSCIEKEGWVLKVDDILYKIKCDDFVNMHRLSNYSPNTIFKLWKEGKLDDLKPNMSEPLKNYVDEYINKFKEYANKINKEIEINYSKFSNIENMKEFALEVNKSDLDNRMKGFMFCKKRNKDIDVFKGLNYEDIK